MFVLTRPKDNARLVVKEDEAEKIKEDWAIVNGTHAEYLAEKKEIESEKELLRQLFSREPSDNDVMWGVLKKQLISHGIERNMGFYRNTRLEMAKILKKEKKLKLALTIFLEISYLDLNGPKNRGTIYRNHPDLLDDYPLFKPSDAFIAPGIITLIKGIVQKLNIEMSDVNKLFIESNERIMNSLKLPVSPKSCWGKLKKELQ